MPRQFAYYPGCVAECSSKELNATTKALAPLLDIELLPMPQATCCGAGDVAQAKPNLYLTLNVRILSEAESMGVDILTICNVCTLNLRRANKMVKEDSRVLEAVNEELVKAGARPYQGTIEVTHLLWFLATEEGLSLLEARGPRGLNGLKVAPYYGCQLLRPSSVMGFEDPDRPQSLERLITALGGEVSDYEGKTRCCGFPIILAIAIAAGLRIPVAYFPCLALFLVAIGFGFDGKKSLIILALGFSAVVLPWLFTIMFPRDLVFTYRARQRSLDAENALPPRR